MKKISAQIIKKAFEDYEDQATLPDKDLVENYELFLSFLDELEYERTDLDFSDPSDLKEILDLMHHSYDGYFESEDSYIDSLRKSGGGEPHPHEYEYEDLSDAELEEKARANLSFENLRACDETYFYYIKDAKRGGYHCFSGQ